MEKAKAKCASSTPSLASWNSIDWDKCEQWVRKLQLRIAKAQKEKRYNKVNALQHLLVTSFYAKALAVKRVTSNKGKRTAGVDKVKWTTPVHKSKAIADHLIKRTIPDNPNHPAQKFQLTERGAIFLNLLEN